jgi:hypothetical protein
MKYRIICLCLMIANCQVDIKQLPEPRQFSSINIANSKFPLYIGKLEVFTAESYNLSAAWRYTFKSILKHNRVFYEILDLNEQTKFQEGSYLLDLEIYPKYTDDYNYWWTWPNVYPFVGYWPVQIRTGKYEISIQYTISKDQIILKKGSVSENDNLTLYLYGTYRTSDFEKMIEISNLKVLDKCAKDILLSL